MGIDPRATHSEGKLIAEGRWRKQGWSWRSTTDLLPPFGIRATSGTVSNSVCKPHVFSSKGISGRLHISTAESTGTPVLRVWRTKLEMAIPPRASEIEPHQSVPAWTSSSRAICFHLANCYQPWQFSTNSQSRYVPATDETIINRP